MRTKGISPKVIAALASAAIGWVVTRYGIDLDPDTCAAIVVVLLTAAGVAAPPGDVVK